VAQNLEHIVDVRVLAAFDPNIDPCIEVEVACGFLREVVDALVGNARVLVLLAGHALLVHEEEALEIGREFRQDAIFWVGADHRIDMVSCLDGERWHVGFWNERIRA
jgi:hypothetical protein